MNERKITLYQGFDPTADSLHIGHFIGLRKLSQFQSMGHKIIFLIGDFTALIGDPTDKSSARTKLTKEQVQENLQNFKDQASSIINFEGENAAEVKFNSEWLSKLNFEETINLASNFTVQQMIERNMFKERMNANKPIYLHEFLYPLMQGYDSVVMEVDLEIGGTDQLFNMMAGRTLMKTVKNKEKFVMSLKLLEDETGWKMGKTEGNAVNLSESAENIYGKIMYVPDTMITIGYELLTDVDNVDENPMNAKKTLAFEVVKQAKGESEAESAQKHFEETFQKSNPDFSKQIKVQESFIKTISEAAGVSASEAKRLISQNAVSVNGEKINNIGHKLEIGDKLKIGTTTFVEIK